MSNPTDNSIETINSNIRSWVDEVISICNVQKENEFTFQVDAKKLVEFRSVVDKGIEVNEFVNVFKSFCDEVKSASRNQGKGMVDNFMVQSSLHFRLDGGFDICNSLVEFYSSDEELRRKVKALTSSFEEASKIVYEKRSILSDYLFDTRFVDLNKKRSFKIF